MLFATTTLFFLSALTPAMAADIGATGKINGLDGGLEGTVVVVNENTLRITDYSLEDASAPALYWWGSTTEDISSGFRINNERVSEQASGETIEIALDADHTADEFSHVGLWCERLGVNFGQAELVQSGSTSGNNTSSGSTSMTSDKPGAGVKTGASAAGALAVAAAFAALMI